MVVVADTNILVSALLWKGQTTSILHLVRDGKIQIAINGSLLNEFERALCYPKFHQQLSSIGKTTVQIVQEFLEIAVLMDDISIPPTILDDLSDDRVLACAFAASAAMIISGDHHLLTLKRWRGIPIVTARTFLNRW